MSSFEWGFEQVSSRYQRGRCFSVGFRHDSRPKKVVSGKWGCGTQRMVPICTRFD